MRKMIALGSLLMVLLAGLLVLPVGAQEDSDGVSLTIYNQGTALVQDRRTFDLEAGTTILNFTDVAASIDATSVNFKSLTDPLGTVVLEQNYVYDLVNSAALLERYIDQRIKVTTLFDGATYEGRLLSGRDGSIILQTDTGEVITLSQSNARDIIFPALPDGLITRPTLRWLLNVASGGEQQVELTYLTGGVSWTADYNLLLNTENTALDLNGWVTLSNTSGAAYTDALVKLVAGDVNRIQPGRVDDMVMEEQAAMPMPTSAPAVEQREFFEYQLYEIGRPVTVSDNETKQVEFVSGADVPASTFYVYDSSAPFYGYYSPNTDPYYGQSGVTDVQNWIEFSTGEDNGLGADLPAGRIRVYQEDVDGAALLIGENSIDHTPKGEDVRFYLGNAFDLVGERTQTGFQFIGDNVLEETWQIKLRNRKDDKAVQIRVPERLARWSNWEIMNPSAEYTKLDAYTIEFRVEVPPGGEVIITYTVRYTWPR